VSRAALAAGDAAVAVSSGLGNATDSLLSRGLIVAAAAAAGLAELGAAAAPAAILPCFLLMLLPPAAFLPPVELLLPPPAELRLILAPTLLRKAAADLPKDLLEPCA
jgi:hypothetical protein